jgi:DNA-binding NarL/FixJ family response regulator
MTIGRMTDMRRRSKMRSMKCLVVDDHALVRDALSLLIAMWHRQVDVRQAASLADARAALATEPDIELVLLDLHLPDSPGAATLQWLRKSALAARVVVVSGDDRGDTVLAALDAGADGFIPKATASSLLRRAIGIVLEGGVYVPAAAVGLPAADPPLSADTLGLTMRQMDVLRLLVDGYSNKSIARSLDLSTSTVKTHLEAIFQRLHVSSRTQAVVTAARLGLRL